MGAGEDNSHSKNITNGTELSPPGMLLNVWCCRCFIALMSVLFKTRQQKREKEKICSPVRPIQLTGIGWLFIEAKRQLGTRSCRPKHGGLIL